MVQKSMVLTPDRELILEMAKDITVSMIRRTQSQYQQVPTFYNNVDLDLISSQAVKLAISLYRHVHESDIAVPACS
jgi:hypothetical protein